MDLNDLYKLAGIQRSDIPAVEPQEVEQQVIEEPTVDGREDMKAMIALVSPEQLNKLVGNAPVEEDMPGENVTTKANPQEFKGTLGSPADLSLRRYLGANGMPVSMDESSVYKDITSDELSEAWNAYKINEKPKNPAFDPFGGAPSSKPNKPVFDPFGGAPGDEGDPIGEPIPEPRPTPKPIPTPGGGPEEPPKPPKPPVGEPIPEPTPAPTPIPTPGGGPEKPSDVEKPKAPKAPEAPKVTDQMRKDAEEYADREGLPLDQLGSIVAGTVGGIPTTLEVDPRSGVVIDTKTGDVIGGDDADAARKKAGIKSESLQRLEYLAGINESYTMMERPSDRSRRGTRPPDAIGPGIIQPRIGEPIPGPRPKPSGDPIIGPGAGDPIGEPIPEPREPKPPMPTPGGGPEEPPKVKIGDPDEGWYIEEPPKPGVNDDPTTKIPQIPMSTKIKPKDVDGDSPDEPDQGKDVFGRDKAALAKKDAIFKKYGLTPPASALFQSADLNEAMQDEEVMAIMAKHPEEVAKMKQMGDMDTNSELYMELYRYYSDEMPYGTMKARDGDPVEYIMDKLDDMGILDEQTVVEEPNEGNRFSGNRQDAIDAGEDEFEVDGKTYKVKKESSELNRLRHLAGTSESAVNEGGSYSWKNGIPDEVMAVISKHNITPDDAWQMANRDNNADIDAIMDAHNDFITRMELEGADTDDDDLYDIDFGEAFMNSPEYAKVMTMVSELCSAMGIENDREECGAGLMQYVDEGATAESEELSILKRNAGI